MSIGLTSWRQGSRNTLAYPAGLGMEWAGRAILVGPGSHLPLRRVLRSAARPLSSQFAGFWLAPTNAGQDEAVLGQRGAATNCQPSRPLPDIRNTGNQLFVSNLTTFCHAVRTSASCLRHIPRAPIAALYLPTARSCACP
jgi:hypothetical protein